jgi:hypothetical protein
VLTYALVLLNTDLHHQNMKTKMTKSEFVRQARNCPELTENEIPDRELFRMYESLRSCPLVFGSDAHLFFTLDAPKMKGALKIKLGRSRHRKWTDRYWIFAYMCLFCYESEEKSDGPPILTVTLENADVFCDRKKTVFRIESRNDDFLHVVEFPNSSSAAIPGVKRVLLRAQDQETREGWVYHMCQAIVTFENSFRGMSQFPSHFSSDAAT